VRHTCSRPSDFKTRKRKAAADDRKRKKREQAATRAARRKQVAADRRARDRARKKAPKGKPRPARPRGESHEPGTCGDQECQKYGCRAYWQGVEDTLSLFEGE
jgi:multidrug efflux pump subunit AcrA (membrane-fusion protein)